MAFPVILVDSTNGSASDSACSGAGPTTALTGTSASTDSLGTTVTLDSGTVLTGVDTTGLHALYLADATTGHRRFARITGSSGSGGSTPTVTVNEALSASLSGKSWAIGGVRASAYGAVSALLWSNNSSAGDAMPGWAVEMRSGHSETVSTSFMMSRGGDTTSGPITLRGASGAATLPLLTFSNNFLAFDITGGVVLQAFEIRNSNATKTASVVVGNFLNGSNGSSSGAITCVSLKVSHSTNKFWSFCDGGSDNELKIPLVVKDCEIGYTASDGIKGASGSGINIGFSVIDCDIHNCGGNGVLITKNYSSQVFVYGNFIRYCSGEGIYINMSSGNIDGWTVAHNTIHGSGGSGIRLSTAGGEASALIFDNLLTFNGHYGFESPASAAQLATQGVLVFGNDTYGNTSGAYSPSGYGTGDAGADPSGGLASSATDYAGVSGGSNFAVGTSVRAKGYPLGGTLAVGTTSSTYSYVDPGAAQRQEPAGGGTVQSRTAVLQPNTWAYSE